MRTGTTIVISPRDWSGANVRSWLASQVARAVPLVTDRVTMIDVRS